MPVLFDADAQQSLDTLSHPEELADHYDLIVTSPAAGEVVTAFDGWLAEAANGYGLSCARLGPTVAHAALERLAHGDLNVGLHVGCNIGWHTGDVFARLAFAVQDSGGQPINLPSRASASTDRAAIHHDLVRHGLGVAPTVILRPWTNTNLTDRQRWHLHLDEPGARLQIVPATGGNVVHIEKPTRSDVAAALNLAREDQPDTTLLVRPEIRPPWLRCSDGEHRPAYWRVQSCLGEVRAFWWQPARSVRSGQGSYFEVMAEDISSHRLGPIFQYVQSLADLTGLEWFSTDLTLSPYPLPGAFTIPDVDGLDLPLVCVGYVNDQSEVDVQSRWRGAMPDGHVRRLACRFADLAWQVRQQTSEGAVWRRAG